VGCSMCCRSQANRQGMLRIVVMCVAVFVAVFVAVCVAVCVADHKKIIKIRFRLLQCVLQREFRCLL